MSATRNQATRRRPRGKKMMSNSEPSDALTAEDGFGIRPGEVATTLPEKFDASVYFIGRIRTPWTRRDDCPKNARESDAICTIEVDPRWADALTGVETCTHLLVLYWMDKARRDLV